MISIANYPQVYKKMLHVVKRYHQAGQKKLDNRYYTVKRYNDRNVYVLNNNAYRQAKVISRPRPGEVRLRVDNRVLDVIEATRVILNVL